MNASVDKAILITGSCGQLGRRVVELLHGVSSWRVVAGTRTPDKAADLARLGADVRRLDFDDPASLDDALQGVARVLMVSTDALSPPGRRVAQHQTMIDAAIKAGVEHVAYTSFSRSEPDSPVSLCADHSRTEVALRASGLRYTALRHSVYAESMVRRMEAVVDAGEVVGLQGDRGIPYVSREDCARVAASVMASHNPPEGAIEVTGPEPVTDAQWAELVSEVSGRPIRYIPLARDALLEHLVASGMPKVRAEWKLALDTAVASGYLAHATRNVERLTGKAPRSLRELLTAAATHVAA